MFETTTTTTRLVAEARRTEIAREAQLARRGATGTVPAPSRLGLIIAALFAVVLPA